MEYPPALPMETDRGEVFIPKKDVLNFSNPSAKPKDYLTLIGENTFGKYEDEEEFFFEW